MDQVLNILASLKTAIWTAALVVGVIVILGILNRYLQRNSAEMTGRRFRNQLIMTGALFIGLLTIILGLPIETTTRGQLLTLIGIILSIGISLSSSTILSNAMAGIMLKTVRNFHSGDFVTVEDYFGRVTERGLFHTEIQTPDRDLVTLPNIYLASNPVTVIRSSGTIVSATVSLGYDLPQTTIKKLLLQAAESIELQDPFVQVLELGDFSVLYRVAGLLQEPKKLLAFRSRLRSAILETMHQGGVEIVSPHFRNIRQFEPQKAFIPAPVRTPKEKTTDAAPVDVVFDKAEVAESLTALKKEREEVDGLLKEARQAGKDAKEEEEKQQADQQVAELEARKEKLVADINETQEKGKEQDT